MRDYGIPEGLPTSEEMWAKLTGNEEIKIELTLGDFQKAMDRICVRNIGGKDER